MNETHPTMRQFLWFAPAARATGNHLAAQNDEPEPVELTPEAVDEEVQRLEREAIEADLHYMNLKRSGELRRRVDEAAMQREMQDLRVRGLL